jgi:nucleotidyltransferase/DNA polymerase involved in DNA repair
MNAVALIDCNNFYVSCERLFQPKLRKEPVIVLSNNDGCVVSRSQEVKDIGIPMGIPLFQIKDEVKKHGIKVYSSNYTLYGDISSRVHDAISHFSNEIENYSIDEAFAVLEVNKYSKPLFDRASKSDRPLRNGRVFRHQSESLRQRHSRKSLVMWQRSLHTEYLI